MLSDAIIQNYYQFNEGNSKHYAASILFFHIYTKISNLTGAGILGNKLKVTASVGEYGYATVTYTYVAIEATANDDGSYSFEAPDNVTEIVIVIKGDVNGDGQVDGSDVTQLKASLLGKRELTAAQKFAGDIGDSTAVAGNDVTQLKATFLGRKALTW